MYTLGATEIEMEGTVVPLSFNSTKYPGTCKPSNERTMTRFKAMQTQLNRVATLRGLSTIAPDGDIGPMTVNLMVKAGVVGAGTTCSDIAVAADAFTASMKFTADLGKVPAKVPAPTPRPTNMVKADGTEVAPPASGISASIVDAFSKMSTPMKMATMGILGGIGYFVLAGNKGKKKGRK